MDFKLILAISAFVLGVTFGVYEIFQMHWSSAACALLSGLITAGIFIFGKEFISETFLGAGLALITTLLGFYGLFFESHALDVELNDARNEIAVALLQAKPICAGIPNPQESFISASKACFLQSNRDQADWIADAAKQIYLPQELGLVDAAYGSLKEQKKDPCSSWVLVINSKCPDVFLPPQKNSIQKLLEK